MALWIDVTDLQRWQGPRTGIPRVVASLSRELAKGPWGAAKACAFDEATRSYVETNFPVETSTALTLPVVSAPAGIKYRLASALRRRLDDDSFAALKDVLRSTWAAVVATARLGRSLVRATARENDAVARHPFAANDVLLVLGSSWGSRGYPGALFEMKASTAFKVVHFVHDLIPFRYPQFYGSGFADHFQGWWSDVSKSVDLVLTNSRRSADDVREITAAMGTKVPDVDIVRLADDIGSRATSSSMTSNEVLCVGTFEVRKNPQLLYQVWKQLVARHGAAAPKIAFVGARGYATDDIRRLWQDDVELGPFVRFVETASDESLARLYDEALCVVYPSIYEGWGLPVAEALARGKAVITTRGTSMEEIAPELLVLHSPWSADEARDAIESLWRDAARRGQLEQRIRSEYKTTTWRETARSVERALGRFFA